MKTAACSYIADPLGRILVVWHKTAQSWSLPGGKVEPGEWPRDAQERELFEETGLQTFVAERFFTRQSGLDPDVCVYVYYVVPLGVMHEGEPGCPTALKTREEILSCRSSYPDFDKFWVDFFAYVDSGTNA